MKINLYSVEVQRDSADFSDAQTVGEFSDVRVATAYLTDSARGPRRLIGWLDLGAMRSPVELLRL